MSEHEITNPNNSSNTENKPFKVKNQRKKGRAHPSEENSHANGEILTFIF